MSLSIPAFCPHFAEIAANYDLVLSDVWGVMHNGVAANLPACEAPLICHQRWEQELAFDEIKTHLNGRSVTIRSKTPAGVVQEIYGLMLAHYAVRRVMHDAATVAMHDPDRLSFMDSLRVLQCRLPESPRLA